MPALSFRACLFFALVYLGWAAAAQAQFDSATADQRRAETAAATVPELNPRAVELFDRDWVLHRWGLRFFDQNADRLMSVAEANAAAARFKQIADGDGDGRVTPYEYDRAREFLIARY
jgi:hypothetical protein